MLYSRIKFLCSATVCCVVLSLQAAKNDENDQILIPGFEKANLYKDSSVQHLEIIQNLLKEVHESYPNKITIDNDNLSEVVRYASFFKTVQNALYHHQSFLDESFLVKNKTDDAKKTYVLAFVSLGFVLEKQCQPIKWFIEQYTLLPQEKMQNFIKALEQLQVASAEVSKVIENQVEDHSTRHLF